MTYFFWEKRAQDAVSPPVQEEPRSDPMRTTSTPQADAQPDPHAEEDHKLKLEGQEQVLQHKQELHEQRMRHTEELHGLKMQTQGAPSGSGGGGAPQGAPEPPMDPAQAQGMSQTNLLANYVQSKMGESFEEEERDEAEGNPVTLEQVSEFLRQNPTPEDSEFHQWAESLGVSPHAAEELAYQLAAQQVTGKPPEDTVEGGPEELKEASSRERFWKVAKELVRGGMADGKPDTKYPQKQVEMGVEVEKEHTPSPQIAKEIAKDHLEESPVYYTELDKMEKKLESKKEGAVLTEEKRDKLPKGDFALPGQEKYPINDAAHARNALARVSQFGTSGEKATVRSKVKSQYPDIEVGNEKKAAWHELKKEIAEHIKAHS
jgi:hypothetical protein